MNLGHFFTFSFAGAYFFDVILAVVAYDIFTFLLHKVYFGVVMLDPTFPWIPIVFAKVFKMFIVSSTDLW